MDLRCLLLTRDDEVLRVVQRVLEQAEIKADIFTAAENAVEALESRKYDAVMIDCDDVHNAITVLYSVRQTPSNKSSTVFAIVSGITSPTIATQLGAHLALEKPITESKARGALRAIHGLMLQERRRYYRHAVEMAVTLLFEDKDKGSRREILATGVNLSEGGMALKVKSSLPWEFRIAQLKFIMPGTHDWVEVPVSIAWADEQGNAGVRFENMPYTLRDRLAKFLRHAEQEEHKKPAPPKQSPPEG